MSRVAITLLFSLAASPAQAAFGGAPSFESPEQLAIVSSDTDVDIAGVVARVTVRQTYVNRASQPIESRYVFPGSTGAAIDGMTMTIGDRKIVAKIQSKIRARQIYSAAKTDGKTASLVEQHRPNVFETSVANILPGDIITVELTYTELLVPEARAYELVLPQVVKARFEPEAWGSRAPEVTPGARVRVHIDAGMPLARVTVRSHDVAPWVDDHEANVTLDAPDGFDRDVIVRYQLAGRHVQTGVLLDEQEDGGTFLLMVQPPARVAPNAITAREYVFIVDVSGSMNGFPLDVTRELLRGLVRGLRSTDRFNVLCFASGSAWLGERPVEPTAENLRRAMDLINGSRGGGTKLDDAMKRALAAPRREGVSTTFVLVTDGFITSERETYELVRNNLDEANVFVFGIGKSVNRHLVESVAKAGMGHPFVATNEAEAEKLASRFHRYVASPVLTDVRLEVDGLDAYDLEPAKVPDVFADRPVVVMGKYRGRPKGSLRLVGRSGAGAFSARMPLEVTREKHPALPKLWARARIEQLAVQYDVTRALDVRKQIERLGLEYSLMTSETSFVAVDERPRVAPTVAGAKPIQKATNQRVVATPELDPAASAGALLLLFAVMALVFDRRRT